MTLGDEISIVIPAFNEEARIGSSLERIVEYVSGRFESSEVIVVDDGSTDRTVEVVRRFPSVRCLVNPVNAGKGASVRRGVLESRYDPVLFSDADLSAPIEEADRLLDEMRSGFDVVIGSRRMSPDQDVERTGFRKLIGWGFATAVKLIAVRGFHDTQCGFKMFRRAAARAIFPLQRIDRWGFDVELLFIARRLGYRISEVPVRWRQSEGTRLKWFTPLTMAWELLRIRFNGLAGRYDARPPEGGRENGGPDSL